MYETVQIEGYAKDGQTIASPRDDFNAQEPHYPTHQGLVHPADQERDHQTKPKGIKGKPQGRFLPGF